MAFSLWLCSDASHFVIGFWSRWHITLTNFITTYLYTPIVKSFPKATLVTASAATILSMTIAGLWHGPRWTFVVFGLIHGFGLAVNQYWRKKKYRKPYPFASWMLTFGLVLVAFVFFRSANLGSAFTMLAEMTNVHHMGGTANLSKMKDEGLKLHIFALPLLMGVLCAYLGASSESLARDFKPQGMKALATVGMLLVGLLFLHSVIASPFAYFAF